MTQTNPRRPVKTVDTAMDIIQVLVESGGMTLSEIAEVVDLAESTTHRHLATLVYNELVFRDGKRYYLSFQFLNIGTQKQYRHPLFKAGREYVDDLAEKTGERVWISTMENGYSISLYWTSDKKPLFHHSRAGQRLHLHVSSVGKAILSELTDEKVDSILDQHGLPGLTDQTITEREMLYSELETIQEQGYATDSEETVNGMDSIAVAVSDDVADILGGIAIGCATNNMTRNREKEYKDLLRETAAEMAIRTRFS
ncbi:IclR family transcriptional regulator [Natrarchaeobius halalkaliphilus]|nr:IclR family transcriptional regulator [Natrarchaeobius halalkaliphilus]